MELVYEKVNELTEEQFEALLDFLGKEVLKNSLIEHANTFPKTSNYYLGARTTGQFWSGFRKENIPASRVRKFYVDEVLKNKTSLNTEFFKDIILAKVSSINEFNENFIMSLGGDTCSALCILYDVSVNEETQRYLNEINELKKQNESAIKSLNEMYEKKIDEINEFAAKQKLEYEKIIKDLKNQIVMALNQNKITKSEMVSKVIDSSSYSNLLIEINSLNFESDESIKNYLINAFEKNSELVKEYDMNTLSRELTIQFILTKIMEEI